MHKLKLPYNLQFFAGENNKLSIFELFTSDDVVAYWETKDSETDDLLGDVLFPPEQKLGLKIENIKGSSGLPVVLLPSAYDVAMKKRDRIGFTEQFMKMPFFKEGTGIDEELRQQLNMVLEGGNRAYIDAIMNRVFDDTLRLLRGAKAQRERMRMSLITSGMISISANGQNYDYDYGFSERQKKTVAKSWSDPTAHIVDEIREWQDEQEEETGERPSRAVVSSKTMGYFAINNDIRNAVWGNNAAAPISRSKVDDYMLSELGLKVQPYSKKFIDEKGVNSAYIPDDLFSLLPGGTLGTSWFGTTPEQSDLLAGSRSNVAITDVGVAVTTMTNDDPVSVDTKVSMIFLPSFEEADKVLVADLVKKG